MKHEGNGDTICNWCAWNVPQRFGKETGKFGNQRKNRNFPDYSIVEISQNAKKSPGSGLKDTCSYSDSREKPSSKARMKTRERNNNNNKVLIQAISIYSQDIRIEFGIEKRSMLMMKKREKRNNGRNRSTKSEKHLNSKRKRKLQVLRNIGSGLYQTKMEEKIRKECF